MSEHSSLPVVSIVIPAFNKAAYLGDAIDSVLAQNYPHLELLVFDDGSTDHTRDILARYGDRFYWEAHENIGQSATLNKGWRMARGEMLGYLSADDVLEASAVARVVAALESHPNAVLAYPDFRLVDPHLALIRMVRAPEVSYKEMLVDFVCPPGPGALFRRSAFLAAGGWNPEYRQMPDYEYWLRLGLQGEFVHVPEVLASFRVHPTSQTYAVVSETRAEEPIRIMTEVFQRPDLNQDLVQLRDRALSNAFIRGAQLHLRAGRGAIAFTCLRQAATLYPRNLYSLHSARALANALFNRAGHRLLWGMRHALRRPAREGHGESRDRS